MRGIWGLGDWEERGGEAVHLINQAKKHLENYPSYSTTVSFPMSDSS